MMEELEVIVGIYEGYVCGYKISLDRTNQIPSVQISKTFAGPLHTQSVRCLTTANHLLASGGADDRVRVYDLQKRQEVRELLHHSGTVNSLVFVDNAKYLITGGADGKIVFINTKKWQIDKVWEKAHKGAVICISVHPEESLALTIGTDLVLKSWNLINGRNVYSTNLKNKSHYGGTVEHIRWSPDGEHFALTGARIIDIFSLDTGNVIKSHKFEHRITDFCWIGEADLLVGQDNGEMFFFNIENEECSTIPAHDSRLKAMQYVDGLLATISSGGELALWYISDDYTEIIQLKEYSLECRPTCLCVVESTKLGLTFQAFNELENLKPTVDLNEQFSVSKKVDDERVIVEYEDDSDLQKIKSNKRNKKRKIIESSLETEIPEAFKGQKKIKKIKENLEQIKKLARSKPMAKKKIKSIKKKAMEFEVTENSEEDSMTKTDLGSSVVQKKSKTKKMVLSKSFVHNPKVLKKKKLQNM